MKDGSLTKEEGDLREVRIEIAAVDLEKQERAIR